MKTPSPAGGATKDPTLQQVTKFLSQPSSSIPTPRKPEQRIPKHSAAPKSKDTIRRLLGWGVCTASSWILLASFSTVDVPFLPDSLQQIRLLSQQYPQQAVLLLLAGHVSLDLLLGLNPTENFHTTEISWSIIEDLLRFVIVAGALFFTMENEIVGQWNPRYMNIVLYGLISQLATKQLRSPKGNNEPYSNNSAHLSNTAKDTQSITSVIHNEAGGESSSNKDAKDPMAWLIHGQEYDLSDFVDRHPGGKESILLGRGRDCTAMFESYHAFTNQHR
jgi:hypothetical protein